MPIRPELRRFYGREWRHVIRPRILARAGNRCEECHAPDRGPVERGWAGKWRYRGCAYTGPWRDNEGYATSAPDLSSCRIVRIVLTVAHLNHTPGDDRDENLKALCQWCHLNYDKLHHKESRSIRKDQARPLLREAV